jgi:hypothetical protein
MWKEVVLAYFKALSQYSSLRAEEDHKNLSQDSLRPAESSNWKSFENISEANSFNLTFSVPPLLPRASCSPQTYFIYGKRK